MKKVLIILATIAGVIALGNVLVAGAQDSTVRLNSPVGSMMSNTTGTYTGTMPYGGRMMHGGGYTGTLPFGGRMQNQMSQMNQNVLAALSAKLGLTSNDLLSALHSGQTLADLAKSKNVSLNDLQSVADAARKAALDDLVKQNVITQQQADIMIAHMQDMQILGFGGGHGFGMQYNMPHGFGPNGSFPGRGMMHGHPSRPQSQPQQPPMTTPSSQG